MSTPDKDTPSFEEQVKATLAAATVDDSGKTIWPEDADPAVLYAARAEKRYRDTQATYTKNQQRLKALEEERNELVTHLEEFATTHLPDDEKAKLDELKYQDPDKWRTELNRLETEAKNKLSETLTDIAGKAHKKSELALRQEQLNTFMADNPELKLTDEVIENDIPPRITKKLADGKVSFEEFLNECKSYLTQGKVIAGAKQDDDEPEVDLGRVAGASKPADSAVDSDIIKSYENEIY